MGGDPGKQGCLCFTGEVFAGKSGDPGLQVGVRIEEETYHVKIRGVWSVGGEKTRHPLGCGVLVGNAFQSKGME